MLARSSAERIVPRPGCHTAEVVSAYEGVA